MMATALSVRPSRTILTSHPTSSTRPRRAHSSKSLLKNDHLSLRFGLLLRNRRFRGNPLRARFGADDSSMSVENALEVLGISKGASFEDILEAKNSILSASKDDPKTIAKVEAAYDMLLMQSLSQRRAGKVVIGSVRYADVKPVNPPPKNSMPQWLQSTSRNSPVAVETPSAGELGLQAGVYGAMMVLTYFNGASTSPVPHAEADVPGLLLASSFGASLYFMTKKNVKLGKATVITIGGLVAGVVVGSAVENLLQVDIVPFLGIHYPAVVISEFIILSQFLVSLYLR